jgi:hypothetical protein
LDQSTLKGVTEQQLPSPALQLGEFSLTNEDEDEKVADEPDVIHRILWSDEAIESLLETVNVLTIKS